MPSKIPNHLHFVWVGNLIPKTQLSNIAKWVLENPRYTVWLWTNRENLKSTVVSIFEIFEHYPQVYSVHQFSGDMGSLVVELVRTDYFGGNTKIIVRSIGTLPAIGEPSQLYEELTHWKNYGAVSDILRVWILHEVGGIYMDCDTFSTGAPLPTDITAPKDILFGGFQAQDFVKLVNAVIAAPKKSPLLKSIAKFIGDGWEREYKKIVPGVFNVPISTHERFQKVEKLRKEIKIAKTQNDGKKCKELQNELWQVFVTPTLESTGPDMLNTWFMHQDVNPYSNQADEYNFQMQTKYKLRIESEQEWVK